jgi:hypothetical protein
MDWMISLTSRSLVEVVEVWTADAIIIIIDRC